MQIGVAVLRNFGDSLSNPCISRNVVVLSCIQRKIERLKPLPSTAFKVGPDSIVHYTILLPAASLGRRPWRLNFQKSFLVSIIPRLHSNQVGRAHLLSSSC
jgi:hypothetical protein